MQCCDYICFTLPLILTPKAARVIHNVLVYSLCKCPERLPVVGPHTCTRDVALTALFPILHVTPHQMRRWCLRNTQLILVGVKINGILDYDTFSLAFSLGKL